MVPRAPLPSYHVQSVPVNGGDAQVLRNRMQKPQRHRLLHGDPEERQRLGNDNSRGHM